MVDEYTKVMESPEIPGSPIYYDGLDVIIDPSVEDLSSLLSGLEVLENRILHGH